MLDREGAEVSSDEIRMVLSHFGTRRLVDEVERICCEESTPLDVVRRVAATFRLADPDGAELPLDRPR